MISAKEAYNISIVNDEFKEYLESVEKKIMETAQENRYNLSIELAAIGHATLFISWVRSDEQEESK